jgi:hypothetical protein
MRALVVLALCGCRGILGIHDPVLQADDVGPPDGGSGSETPGDTLPVGCYGTTGWLLCLDAPPTAAIDLSGTIDTDTSPLCLAAVPQTWVDAGQPDACVIAGAMITGSAEVNVTGTRPLVIIADTKIELASTAILDIASHRIGGVGPAANATACLAGGNGGNSANGAGGAAGGSFTSPGGDGGDGIGAGGGGTLATVPVPDLLRGGCPGGRGGTGNAGSSAGGASGGAVYLVAGVSMSLGGFVNASGAGATGASGRGGGGGGGAGGMIALAAPLIDVPGIMLANGGGGAEGGSDTAAGGNGQDPDITLPMLPALGGDSGSNSAGDGGAGAAATLAAANGRNAAAGSSGGGGGGGSVGVIRVLTGQQLAGNRISPPPVP